jgi:N-acetylmuramic acid 6-phosphate etherase
MLQKAAPMSNNPTLNTEAQDLRFTDIDQWPTVDAVDAMLEGQLAALTAIKGATLAIANAANEAAERLKRGGRLVYAGAGTSGRVSVQDGVELGPTFGWPEERLAYLVAGGVDALVRSAEGAEDDYEGARAEIEALAIGANDVVIGVAASGRTRYTIGAIEAAREAGALTIAIANNADSALLHAAEHALLAATGSEIIAGSTRMKAGTAQKAMLNMLSTAIMLRLGRVYKGLMVDMQISNDKLLARGVDMVAKISGCSNEAAEDALAQTDRNIKAAILVAMGETPIAAKALLEYHHGILRSALEARGGKRE